MSIERGTVVISKMGRDAGKALAVLSDEGQRVIIADGKERKLSNPKAKNLKHLQKTNTVLSEADLIQDSTLRRALRRFNSEENNG